MRALEPTAEEPGAMVEGLAIAYETSTNVGNWFIEVIDSNNKSVFKQATSIKSSALKISRDYMKNNK